MAQQVGTRTAQHQRQMVHYLHRGPQLRFASSETDMFCDYTCRAVYHRMYVLEGSTSDPWSSKYIMKGQLNTFDQFAIDGTYFQHSTGLYHIYSCWYRQHGGWPANLRITKMSNPWTVTSNLTERQIISVPSNPWERTPYGRMVNYRLASNEGPEQLVNPKTGQQFVIYSAARSDNRNSCLGQLELVGDDPMNPSKL
jgi:GH43 family beta-xylosidase